MPLRPTTLVATDLDGTLVPHGEDTLPPYTARVLADVDRAGVPVVFATARPMRWMTGLWPHVGRHGWAIVSNGAIVLDVHNQQIVELIGIDPEPGLALCAAITAALPGACFAIECADGVRFDPHYQEVIPDDESPRGPLTSLWTDPAVKLLVRNPSVSSEELRAGVSAAVGHLCNASWSSPGLVEISALGVSKASALQDVCARLGLQAADAIVFGDMPNDIEMLTWAGTSYAVAGAHPSVLEIADHVAPACADEGVAQVLEQLLGESSPASAPAS